MTKRVLIIRMPSLLRQIVLDALKLDDRAEVIECGKDEEDVDLTESIKMHEPDVIVTTSEDSGLDPVFEEFLSEEPERSVLTIERIGRSAYLFSMQPDPLSLGEVSTDALVKAVHGEFTEH